MSRRPQRTSELPRFIIPECIAEGDVIQVSWASGGVSHTRTAEVDKIRTHESHSVFYTKEGTEIFHHITGRKVVRVTLLAIRKPEKAMTLFDLVGQE